MPAFFPKSNMNLDVDNPENVSKVLRKAADRFYSDGIQMGIDYPKRQDGKVWEMIAKTLEAAADHIDMRLKRMR